MQTPAIKASSSLIYPEGAWDLGYTGNGSNIAIVDTGIDDEHPGLSGKSIAGFDAVCTDTSDGSFSGLSAFTLSDGFTEALAAKVLIFCGDKFEKFFCICLNND